MKNFKTFEDFANEAMVQVAGKGKPAGAQVLANEIVTYLERQYNFPEAKDKNKLMSEIKNIIMDSTF